MGIIIIFEIGIIMENAVAKIQWMEQGKNLRLMIPYGAAITPF